MFARMLRWHLVAVVGFALVVRVPLAAASGRCNAGQLAGGLHCTCPDILGQLAQNLVGCPTGYEPVVYDLSSAFPPDGTTSTIIMRGSPGSQCPTLERTIGVSGHAVICWGPPQDGCRQ